MLTDSRWRIVRLRDQEVALRGSLFTPASCADQSNITGFWTSIQGVGSRPIVNSAYDQQLSEVTVARCLDICEAPARLDSALLRGFGQTGYGALRTLQQPTTSVQKFDLHSALHSASDTQCFPHKLVQSTCTNGSL
jgi:hypothetical protein